MSGGHLVWLALLLIVVLIIFGPKRLPELGSALGRGIREFRKATDGVKEEVSKATSATSTEEPAAAAPDPNAKQA